MLTKKCRVCGEIKSADQFYEKFLKCKTCVQKIRKIHTNTNVDSFFSRLLCTANGSAKKRAASGRAEAGVFAIDLSDLQNLYAVQDCCCYYSGVKLNLRQNSDWQCSLERLDVTRGYVPDNIVLIAAEFQGASQWSSEKYDEFVKLIGKKHGRQHIDWYSRKKSLPPRDTIRSVRDGIEHCLCNYCNTEKPLDQFYKILSGGCRTCTNKRAEAYRATPRGHFCHLLSSMKTRSKKKNYEFDLDIDDLIRIWEKQKGLCAYSGIKMTFGSHHDRWWTCSVERRNVMIGYTIDNTSLICYEFNTCDNTAKAKDAHSVTGTTSWTRDKIAFIKCHELDKIISNIQYLYV